MSVSTPPEHHLTLNRLATIARLVAGAAHEVNNALQVIGGSAELLQNRTDLPEAVQKTLAHIRDQAARAASAAAGAVALSRAQPDGVTYLVDMGDIASRAIELRRYSIGRADLTVGLDAPSMPQLVKLRAMLVTAGVQRVVMESTSDYWRPVFYVLGEQLDVVLVQASAVKAIPGRKRCVRCGVAG